MSNPPQPAAVGPRARNRTLLVRLYRLSQIVFLLLFLVLLVSTKPHFFLQADPFAALSNALATCALYRGLLWSLTVLIPTFFLGRFFCGWICPLGTLHHFLVAIPSELARSVEKKLR